MKNLRKNYFWFYVIGIFYIGVLTQIIINIRNKYFDGLALGTETDRFMSIGWIIDGVILSIIGTVFGVIIPYIIIKPIFKFFRRKHYKH